jgi:hypothetical protein
MLDFSRRLNGVASLHDVAVQFSSLPGNPEPMSLHLHQLLAL